MHAYRILDTLRSEGDQVHEHRATLGEAHQSARDCGATDPQRMRVELVDIDASKAGLIDLLNGAPRCTLLRTWALTRRGGLVEIANGD